MHLEAMQKDRPPGFSHDFTMHAPASRLPGEASDELERRCGVVCHDASFVCVIFLCFWLDNRPTRAGAALRAAPLERGWAITARNSAAMPDDLIKIYIYIYIFFFFLTKKISGMAHGCGA